MSFEHKKSLGQNFLNSDYIPKKLCAAGEVTAGDRIFEIGPGTGALTKELLASGASVTALEADTRAIAILEETFSEAVTDGSLRLIHGDARSFSVTDYGLVDKQFKVIANIPYYLSGLLLRNLLESNTQPSDLVFLMQKELVERIARAKKESLLSLSVKAFGQPSYVCTVKRGHFTPAPKVDSAILRITNINRGSFTEIDTRYFFDLLQLGFGSKRKQLAGNLKKSYSAAAIEAAFEAAVVPSNTRAEDLPISTWLTLAKALQTQK